MKSDAGYITCSFMYTTQVLKNCGNLTTKNWVIFRGRD